jgi:FtsP/CotA-like multicopper oxidase with cupredoxin domain
MCRCIGGALLGAALTLALSCASPNNSPDIVNANDNTAAAGRQRAGLLSLHLVARQARWSPEGADGPAIMVPAFAEEGKSATVPGPLIRVPRGTQISVSIRNALPDSTISVHGLFTRPAASADSVMIKPGETKQLRFEAGAPGTYLYYARIGHDDGEEERQTLAGAFVVDSSGQRRHDRIFVINVFGEQVDSQTYRNALAINGHAWPYTERVRAKVGETMNWRVVNASIRPHPMHLHGFYFQIGSLGDAFRDTIYSPQSRFNSVTHQMAEETTMTLSWTPDRAGNWLFHCHLGFHVIPEGASLAAPKGHEHPLSADAGKHMAGLVLGIEVRGSPSKAADPPPRQLRLFVQEGRPFGHAKRGLGFVLQRDEQAPAPDSIELPGSVLVLERGQPTDITVFNKLRENTGVHWHGIELESPSDGVAGWSGSANNLAPAIAPGDSFTAHLTLPRAGTFIYHTHLNDLEQLTAGMYGALLVLEPGQPYDPRTDHVFVFGWNGPADPPHIVTNGDTISSTPLEVEAGRAQRLRFINIGVAVSMFLSLKQNSTVLSWRALAKDGADLPPNLAVDRRAEQRVSVGETFDFRFTPKAGQYTLVAGHPTLGTFYTRTIIAR